MFKLRFVTAAVFSLALLLGTQAAQAAVGVRGIAFCNNGEEIWIDVGPYFYNRTEAKMAFADQVYSVCIDRWGLSFFTRTYYYGGGTSCPTPYPYWNTPPYPYWGD